MRHQITIEDARAHVVQSIMAASSCSRRQENKKLKVIVQGNEISYMVKDHGEIALVTHDIEEAVNAYNDL